MGLMDTLKTPYNELFPPTYRASVQYRGTGRGFQEEPTWVGDWKAAAIWARGRSADPEVGYVGLTCDKVFQRAYEDGVVTYDIRTARVAEMCRHNNQHDDPEEVEQEDST